MKILIIISSKSPNDFLLNCIQKLYRIQIDNDTHQYKICVIDSDSDNNSVYYKISKQFPNIDIYIVKNKNYEYGAWKKGYEIYPDYDIYFTLQDSMIITQKIDLNIVNDNNAYIWKHISGYFSHTEIKEKGIENLKTTNLNYEPIIDTRFSLAFGSIFIVSNNVLKDMLNTLTVLPTDKTGSCIYERNIGIYFICKNINTIDLQGKLIKEHKNRI
jgi:hypothetical protein